MKPGRSIRSRSRRKCARSIPTIRPRLQPIKYTVLWYAPSVNRWVRRTYKLQVEGRLRSSNTEELTDYSRKP